MRHDLMARYAAEGEMPVFGRLLERGASSEDGCLPALPTNTGAGWATLQTGAWAGTSGAITTPPSDCPPTCTSPTPAPTTATRGANSSR